MPRGEREDALHELAEGTLEFLFLAPEQLARRDVLDELAVADISLFVVDEAHCVSRVGARLPARVPAPRRGDRGARAARPCWR